MLLSPSKILIHPRDGWGAPTLPYFSHLLIRAAVSPGHDSDTVRRSNEETEENALKPGRLRRPQTAPRATPGLPGLGGRSSGQTAPGESAETLL